MTKPILFLDFDYTLFDTAQFYDWLGTDIDGRITKLVSGEIAGPDFASMLYPDTLAFLNTVQKIYHRVLLSYANNVPLQEKKVARCGITPHLDDVIIVPGVRGEGGKAREAKNYLLRSRDATGMPVLVDDTSENFAEIRAADVAMRCIRIDRDRRLLPKTEESTTAQKPDAIVSNLTELFALLSPVPPR